MRCDNCEQDPCTCQRTLTPNGQGEWVVGHCEVPGCGVRIRYRLGQAVDMTCKWHQAGTARYTQEQKNATGKKEENLDRRG